MALVNCHECGASVSTEAAGCPKCGAPPKQPAHPTGKSSGCAVVFVVIGGVIALMIVFGGILRRTDPPIVNLDAAVSHDATAFLIENRDKYDWQHCDFELNNSYRTTNVSIERRGRRKIPATDFVTSSGARFNILTTKPLALSIRCRETNWGAESYGPRSTFLQFR